MASAKSSLMDHITALDQLRPDAGTLNTTVATANVLGATTLVCADTAVAINTSGKVVFIGSGETLEIGIVSSVSTVTITLQDKLTKVHAVGELVCAGFAYAMGAPLEGGVTATFNGASTDIKVATKRLPLATLNGYVTAEAALKLPFFSAESFMFATGSAVATVTGSGTAASPKGFATDGTGFGAAADTCLVCTGIKLNGTYFRVELWGVDADYTGISAQLSRGSGAPVDIKFKASAGVLVADAAPAYTAVTTYVCTKAQVFDFLTDAGVLIAATGGAALSTTTTADAAAGDTLLALTAATGVAVGTILEVDTGDNMEHVIVHSLSSLNATLKNKLFRAHASTCVVKAMSASRFAAIGEAGVKIGLGGSFDEFKAADFRMPIGHRAGEVALTMDIPVLGVTQEVLSQALGMTTTIDSSRRTLFNTAIGATSPTCVYAKGQMQNGDVVWVFGSGPIIQVSNVQVTLNNAGTPPPIMVTARPTTCFRFFYGPGI